MTSREVLKKTMTMVADKQFAVAVEFIRDHFATNKLDGGFSKEAIRKQIEKAIAIGTGKKNLDPEPIDFINVMTGQRRVPRILIESEITALRRILQIIENAKEEQCDHSDAKIVPLVYGGGFSPMEALPELLCPSCGLNITLTPHKEMIKAGLSAKYLRDLLDWSRPLLSTHASKVRSSREIPEKLKEVFETSIQYDGDMEPIFKAIRKLEPFSGQ